MTWAVFSALPVTWAEERPHDQDELVQPLYSSANQVAQTRAAGYLESTRLAGQGEELDVFLLFFAEVAAKFLYTQTHEQCTKTTGYFLS